KDPRIIRAKVANFIDTLRLVSVDPALQRNYIYKTYESLRRGDPAFEKANIFYQDNKTNPFKLGKNISRNIEIKSLNRQTDETYQIDWLEKTYDKKGILLNVKEFRALVTVFLSHIDVESVDQLIDNPLGIYIRDYNISELKTSDNSIIKNDSKEVYEDESK
ncbi:MAG: type IV secretion system protein, partial [Mucispirillum schaedleri]|nr:type IV secretion system protein [Mucispirillum schaedleri]